MKNPGEHRSRRGLAVSSSDDQHFFALEKFVMQQLWERAKRNALVENVLEFDITARHGVPDDNKIRTRLQIFRIERLRQRDAEFAQEIGHGRIGGGIGACNVESALLEHACERGHGRAADTDQMNVLGLGHSKNINHKGH